MHKNRWHLGTRKSVGQPGKLGHSGLERRTGGCGVDPELGKLWCAVGGRKIRGPKDPQRLHGFRFGSDAVHQSLVEHGSTLDLFWRCPTHHLSIERREAAVANTTQRVYYERAGHSFVMRREQVEQQVATPGMAPHYRAIPAEMRISVWSAAPVR